MRRAEGGVRRGDQRFSKRFSWFKPVFCWFLLVFTRFQAFWNRFHSISSKRYDITLCLDRSMFVSAYWMHRKMSCSTSPASSPVRGTPHVPCFRSELEEEQAAVCRKLFAEEGIRLALEV